MKTEGESRLSSIWMHESASVMRTAKPGKPQRLNSRGNYSTEARRRPLPTAAAPYCLLLETSVSKAASDTSAVRRGPREHRAPSVTERFERPHLADDTHLAGDKRETSARCHRSPRASLKGAARGLNTGSDTMVERRNT